MASNTVLRRPAYRLWWHRLIGEINVLRSSGLQSFGFFTPYQLDSSRVDYALARALYRNTDDRYKLGAGFAKPIVNTTAGFMGAPHFSHADPDADQALEDAMDGWTGKLLRSNRNALRDGDVFTRIARIPDRFNPREELFDLQLVPPEWVTPVTDPLTGSWQEIVIRHPVKLLDKDGKVKSQYTIVETLTPTARTVEADGAAPPEVRARNRSEPNPWGFIPIVHARNEAEEDQVYGASDLEPVEPFLKAYHDVMLFAAQGSKLFSRPKARFSLKNVQKFLSDNFSTEEIQSGRLRFAEKELFLMQEGEEAAFITADSGLAGITTLLKFLFFCIVDVSETPEFAFGTAVQSSKASVSEQMVPLARKIRRKRGHMEEPYGELASMYLAMWARVENSPLETYRVQTGWEELSPRNDSEVATTIKTLIEGLAQGVESGLLSLPAASEFLREFVPSMLPWVDPDADDDERRRVAKTMDLMRRLQDGEGLPGDDGQGGPGAGEE